MCSTTNNKNRNVLSKSAGIIIFISQGSTELIRCVCRLVIVVKERKDRGGVKGGEEGGAWIYNRKGWSGEHSEC